MKFKSITLETFNSTHNYLVGGVLKLKYDGVMHAIKIEVTLELPILFFDEAHVINVHGLEFKCDEIAVERNKIYGIIENIDSQQYRRKYKKN